MSATQLLMEKDVADIVEPFRNPEFHKLPHARQVELIKGAIKLGWFSGGACALTETRRETLVKETEASLDRAAALLPHGPGTL